MLLSSLQFRNVLNKMIQLLNQNDSPKQFAISVSKFEHFHLMKCTSSNVWAALKTNYGFLTVLRTFINRYCEIVLFCSPCH